MRYVIKNDKNIYIRLNKEGQIETCSEQYKSTFEYVKARNIYNHLPRTLKRLHFKVIEVIENPNNFDNDVEPIKNESLKVLDNYDYEPQESITRWVGKFGVCSDVLNDAKKRKNELDKDLRDADKELTDILHIIEIEKSKDLFGGWKLYKRIRENRKKRRSIKDEILIIDNVLEKIKDISVFDCETVQKAINGLTSRKYRFRIVEEDE